MATGRWVVEHHQIPSTDVFSYTAHGQPWTYPVGSGLLFYGLYLLGGYALLSRLGAAACAGTTAAAERLRASWPWLVATFGATLVNPWGRRIFEAVLRQEQAMAAQLQ